MLARIRAWFTSRAALEDALEVEASTRRDIARVDAELQLASAAGDSRRVAELNEKRLVLEETLTWAADLVASARR